MSHSKVVLTSQIFIIRDNTLFHRIKRNLIVVFVAVNDRQSYSLRGVTSQEVVLLKLLYLCNKYAIMSKKQDDLSIGSTNLKNVVRISRKKANEAEEMKTIISSASAEAIVSGFPPTPILDLTFRKGNRISELSFVNFYVGNSESWNQADIKSIDFALAVCHVR